MWEYRKQITFFSKIPFKKTVKIIFLTVFLPALPIVLTFLLSSHPLRTLFVFYLVNALLVLYFFKKHTKKIRDRRLRRESVQEQINVVNYQNSKELQNQVSLKDKIRRYWSLKEVIEQINATLTIESIAEHLSASAFSLIASGHGTAILYLIDRSNHSLSLLKAKKEDKKIIVRAKQGDIFDHWVLRHASPLLIEDIKKDFRFDLEKFKNEDMRPVSSLISSPLISGNNFLGILRLDHPQLNYYSQDDLRFLMTICDLGAVALENGELYQNTQELAIRDGLTGLFNKGHFMELLKLECKRSVRHGKHFSLLMLDIDYFKNYNDKFGHAAGDIVLKNLSQTLIEILKDKAAAISRFGGEEFCIILPGIDKKEAQDTAQGLRKQIEDTKIILRRQETVVTVSVGVATFPEDASDEVELIMNADKAMYKAKQSGRNRVAVA